MPPLCASDQRFLVQLADPGEDAPTFEGVNKALPTILEVANYHRVLPTVLARLSGDLSLHVPQYFRDQLTLDAAQMMALRHMGNSVLAALSEACVPAVIVKGEHFAMRFYPPPIWRPYTDVDLLIEQARIADARAVMHKLGFSSCGAFVKYDTGYAEDKWVCYQSGFEILVELHWDLINSPSLRRRRRLSYHDVVASDGSIDAAGDLLVACVHGTLGHTFERLYHLVDIAQAARGMGDAFDPREVEARARSCGLCDIVALALIVTGRLFNDEVCLELPKQLGLSAPPSWVVRLLDLTTLMKQRGSLDPRVAWRRPLVREWLKHRTAAA